MKLGTMRRVPRMPHFRARVQVLQGMRVFLRLQFVYAALEVGLVEALRRPRSREELVRRLGVRRPEMLDVLLRMGVSLGELSVRGGVYRLRGGYARAMVGEEGNPLAAMVQEYLGYHADAYRRLAERLRGAPMGDYMEGTGDLIARSSRVLEPLMADFVQEMAREKGAMRILEVGCGSGVYLRYAAEANPEVTGIGIDMQQDVVEQATRNLRAWGLGDRFRVLRADIRDAPPEIEGPFDLITLYNNIYYFTAEERPALLRDLRSRLARGGGLAIVTVMRDNTVMALDFDLILRSTKGCAPLPTVREVEAQLRESGFGEVSSRKLVWVESLYGVVARQ